MHCKAVYVREGLLFAHDLPLENSANSCLCFWLACLHFCFLYQSPSLSTCTVFDSISSNIDEILSINLSANVFFFGVFSVYQKDWLTYSGDTDRPGEFCYNFSFSNDLTQMVNFPTWIPLLFWIYFFLLTLLFLLQGLFFHWENLIMLFSQFPLTFGQTQNRMCCFIT